MRVKKRSRPSTAIIPGDLGYFKNHIGYYKQMKKLLEARQTQVDLISMRRKTIQDSNVLNYQNEYDRIKGALSNLNEGVRGNSLERLQQREGELAVLGARAVVKMFKLFYCVIV